MDPPATIAISQVQREDIPHLANIYMITCLLDNAMKLNHPTPQQYIQSTTSTLEGLLGNPAWRPIKAVDIATGTIAAWACWVTVTPGEARAKLEATGFSAFLRVEIEKMLDKFTGGKKYMRCMACFTHPEFQGRGMGKAMVKYGNEIADKEGIPIYLMASPAVSILPRVVEKSGTDFGSGISALSEVWL
jgi:GNAT superfamily N-acetyltransferase